MKLGFLYYCAFVTATFLTKEEKCLHELEQLRILNIKLVNEIVLVRKQNTDYKRKHSAPSTYITGTKSPSSAWSEVAYSEAESETV